MSIALSKVFTWNTAEDAVLEYEEFHSLMEQKLIEGGMYILKDEANIAVNYPDLTPLPDPPVLVGLNLAQQALVLRDYQLQMPRVIN